MAASLQEIDELLYSIDREELKGMMIQGANAILEVVLDKLSEEGIDKEKFLDAWNTSMGIKSKKEPGNTQTPLLNTVPAAATVSSDVQPPVNGVKNVKQEKISIALESDDLRPMPPPKKPAPRVKKIKTEPPDEHLKSTRSKNTRDQSNKESVIIQVPVIPLVDLTNNSISPRRTRSKVKQATIQVHQNMTLQENTTTQLDKKNNAREVVENKNTTEDNEEGGQQIKAGDDADKSKSTKRNAREAANVLNNSKTNSSEVLTKAACKINQKIEAQPIPIETTTDLNQTYILPSESQSTNMPVSVKQPPKEIKTPTKSKPPTPLKSSKTKIPQFKSPSSTSTPFNTFKASQKVVTSEQKQKQQESLRKKEEVLQALEKSNKEKDARLQKEHEIKKKAQMKQEAARNLMEKKKAEEYLKKKQEEKMKAAHADSSRKMEKKLIYMTKETPLLPTVDCYDSDEEHKQQPRPRYPEWVNGRLLERDEMVGNTTGKMNTLFIKNIVTPDLKEVFEWIDAKKLVRSSSAHWKEPPRYTLFKNHNQFYFSDDEDV